MDLPGGDFQRPKGYLWSHPSRFQQRRQFRRISFEELKTPKDDIFSVGSDDDLSTTQHVAKKKRIERLADAFLDGKPLLISCARPCPDSVRVTLGWHRTGPSRAVQAAPTVPSSSVSIPMPSNAQSGRVGGEIASIGGLCPSNIEHLRAQPIQAEIGNAVPHNPRGTKLANHKPRINRSISSGRSPVTAQAPQNTSVSAHDGRSKSPRRRGVKDIGKERATIARGQLKHAIPRHNIASENEKTQVAESIADHLANDVQRLRRTYEMTSDGNGSSRAIKFHSSRSEARPKDLANPKVNISMQQDSARETSYHTAPENIIPESSVQNLEIIGFSDVHTEETSQEQLLRQQGIRANPRKTWATINHCQEEGKIDGRTRSVVDVENYADAQEVTKRASTDLEPISDKVGTTESDTTPFDLHMKGEQRLNDPRPSANREYKKKKHKPKTKDFGNTPPKISELRISQTANSLAVPSIVEENSGTKPSTTLADMPLVDQHLNRRLPAASPSGRKSKTLKRALRKQLLKSGAVIVRPPNEHTRSSPSEESSAPSVMSERIMARDSPEQARRQSAREYVTLSSAQGAPDGAQREKSNMPDPAGDKSRNFPMAETTVDRTRKGKPDVQRTRLSGESFATTQQLINGFDGWSSVKKPGVVQNRGAQITPSKGGANDTTKGSVNSTSFPSQSPRTPLRKQMARLSDVLAPGLSSGTSPLSGDKNQDPCKGRKLEPDSSALKPRNEAISVDADYKPAPARMVDASVRIAASASDGWGLSLGNDDTSITQLVEEVANDVLDVSDMNMVLEHVD